MPAYGTLQVGGVLTSLQPGDQIPLWNAESPAAGTSSVAVNLAYAQSGQHGLTFAAAFGGVQPSAAEVDIQASNTDVDADYVTQGSINTFPGTYADAGLFAYYRAKLTSNTGGTGTLLSVIVQRN